MSKICPCCGDEFEGRNTLCGHCQDFIDDEEAAMDRWCPECGSVTQDDMCPACGYMFDYEAEEAWKEAA